MRKLLYFVLLLVGLSACESKYKPFEILPMTAHDVRMDSNGHWKSKDYPLPNFFYFKNFRDDKQCLKKLMQYIKDTIATKIAHGEITNEAFFCKKNKGYFDRREGNTDQKHFFLYFTDSLATHYQWFATLSDYKISWVDTDEFPKRCDYPYHIIRKNKVAVIYFDYKEFNTDVWQKFLNVVFYDRYSIKQADHKKYKLYTPPQGLNWRNWSAPTRYSLLNQHTREIECVIEYPLEDDYTAFTMEIR